MPKPPPARFFRKSTQSFYVKLAGKFHPLGKDREKVWEKYHELMLGRQPTTPATPVVELLGKFLTWCEIHRSPGTYGWYRDYLRSFQAFIGARLTVAALMPHHVEEWVAKRYANRSSSYKNGACRAVARVFNWACKKRHIGFNPVTGVERPRAEPRGAYITPEQWERIVAAVDPSDPFLDLLILLRETGCRVNEAKRVEARHFKRDNETWTFPEG